MKIQLKRIISGTDSTIGLLSIDGKVECWTLEDEHREVKLKGETRIPADIYEVKLRKETTPLTKRYRERHPWFTYHLEISAIPNFNGVYIHIGNTHKHTEGCVLVAQQAVIDGPDSYQLEVSTLAFEKFYKRVRQALLDGENVTIEILDIW